MDRYMGLLAWSIDSRAYRAMRERLGHVPTKIRYHVAALVIGTAVIVALLVVRSLRGGASSGGDGTSSSSTAVLALIPVAGYLLGSLINFIAGAIYGLFAGYDANGFTARARFLMARFRDHRIWMMGFAALALSITVALFATMPQQFQPNSDRDFSQLRINMVPGTTILQDRRRGRSGVAEIINKQPEVNTAVEIVQEGSARLFITLKPDRKRTSIEFERDLTPQLAQIPDARVSFSSQNGGGGTVAISRSC